VFPECGHLPHVEKGDEFAAELESFIDALPSLREGAAA
jgi:pimeloyl-ACP methyl ester carboxylesterase